jgi:hypothetical protein
MRSNWIQKFLAKNFWIQLLGIVVKLLNSVTMQSGKNFWMQLVRIVVKTSEFSSTIRSNW